MAFGTTLAQALAALASSRHVCCKNRDTTKKHDRTVRLLQERLAAMLYGAAKVNPRRPPPLPPTNGSIPAGRQLRSVADRWLRTRRKRVLMKCMALAKHRH